VNSLHEMQRRMLAALRGEELQHGLDWLDAGDARGPSALDRLGIHHNNWRAGFRKALALSFPVVERLVGEPYFRRLAADFQDQVPSRSGDLNRIAAPFPAYVAARFAATEFAYLGDMARLELLCQQVQGNEPQTPAGIGLLAGRPLDECARFRCRLQPNARLLESRYPISRIWLANQSHSTPETIDLNDGGEQLLLVGSAAGVELHCLRPGEYALLQALGTGQCLGDALAMAVAAVPDLQLATGLHRIFASAALCLC
jgi:hypothetical protein